MKAFKKLFEVELKLSLRGIDMFIFAICMPIVILVVIGIIYGKKPAFEGANFTFVEQSFGAIASIAICAGGVMGLPLVVSDYRSKHILKRFKVTPIKPFVIIFVQVGIYSLYALISLLTLFAVAILFFGFHMHGNILLFVLGWFLVMISMFSIGILVGGLAKDSKIAGVIASILYFPMMIFLGATLPYEVMPTIMQKMVDFFPLTQGIMVLKAASIGLPIENMFLPICILMAVAIICITISVKFFKWE